MSSIVLTIFGTVISGVAVHYLIEKLDYYWMEPYHEYKKLKGKVIYALSFYANVYGDPCNTNTAHREEREMRNRVSEELRQIGCELYVMSQTRNRCTMGIPSKENLSCAGKSFIALSNGLFVVNADTLYPAIEKNEERVERIKKCLNIQ